MSIRNLLRKRDNKDSSNEECTDSNHSDDNDNDNIIPILPSGKQAQVPTALITDIGSCRGRGRGTGTGRNIDLQNANTRVLRPRL